MFLVGSNNQLTKRKCAQFNRTATSMQKTPLTHNGAIITGVSLVDRKTKKVIKPNMYAGKCLVVIDFDVNDDTDFQAPPIVQDTYLVRTGSGGIHAYYFITDGAVNNTANLTPQSPDLKAIDIRGQGGIIFASGCKFKDHKQPYSDINSLEPKEITHAEYQDIMNHLIITFEEEETPSVKPTLVPVEEEPVEGLTPNVLDFRQGFKDIIEGRFIIQHGEQNGNEEFVYWKALWREVKGCNGDIDVVKALLSQNQPEYDEGETDTQIKYVDSKRPTKKLYVKLFPQFKKTACKAPKIAWDIQFIQYWTTTYGDEYVYIYNTKKYMAYRDGVYEIIEVPQLRDMFRDYLIAHGIERQRNKLNTMFEYIQEKFGFYLEDFDKDKNIINFKNGLYNLTDKIIVDHTMDYKSLIQLEISYIAVPNPTPYIDKFRNSYPDEMWQIERYVQSMLHRDTSHELMLNLLGPTRSGKGTILNLINSIFNGVCVNGDIHNLGSRFGLGPLIGKMGFMDKEMATRGFDTETINMCKKITGGDTKQGISIEVKGIDAFTYPLDIFLLTATNQFGNLPASVDQQAWFSRTNIVELDLSFKSDSKMKNEILNEVSDWVSELLLLEYHNWVEGTDKAATWAPRQKELWENSSKVYKNIATKWFKKSMGENLALEDVMNFFNQVLSHQDKGVPPENVLKGLITKEFAKMGIRKKSYGRERNIIFVNIAPIDEQAEKLWYALTEVDCKNDEFCPDDAMHFPIAYEEVTLSKFNRRMERIE